MLLTRLKNRNKTVPISQPLPSTAKGSQFISRNNWTEGEI